MKRLITLAVAVLPAFASTIVDANISGFGTNLVIGSATASYFGDTSLDPSSILASASYSATASGSGSGFLRIFDASIFGEAGGGSSIRIGDYRYGSGCTPCSPLTDLNGSTYLPFALGVPFEVDVSAFGQALGSGSGAAAFKFQVFEAVSPFPGFPPQRGAAVPIFDPPVVPEPTTAILCAGGLALLAVGRRLHRTRTP